MSVTSVFVEKYVSITKSGRSVLKNSEKLTGKNLCWSLSFNKVAGLPFFTE